MGLKWDKPFTNWIVLDCSLLTCMKWWWDIWVLRWTQNNSESDVAWCTSSWENFTIVWKAVLHISKPDLALADLASFCGVHNGPHQPYTIDDLTRLKTAKITGKTKRSIQMHQLWHVSQWEKNIISPSTLLKILDVSPCSCTHIMYTFHCMPLIIMCVCMYNMIVARIPSHAYSIPPETKPWFGVRPFRLCSLCPEKMWGTFSEDVGGMGVKFSPHGRDTSSASNPGHALGSLNIHCSSMAAGR